MVVFVGGLPKMEASPLAVSMAGCLSPVRQFAYCPISEVFPAMPKAERIVVTDRDRTRLKHAERQAEGYLELGMAEHALEILFPHGQQRQLSPRGLYLWGEALRSLERYQEALAPLEAAAETTPDSIQIRLAQGWCYKRVGNIPLAVASLERAVDSCPDNALLHYNLACYLSLAGRKPQALKHLSRALVLEPDYRLMIEDEPDFDPIRNDPTFVAMTRVIV